MLTRRTALTAGAGLAVAAAGPAPSTAPAIVVGEAQIPSDGGDIAGVFAKPAGAGPFPIVLVAGAAAGLGPFIANSCRGLAREGYLAVAPDLLANAPPDGQLMLRLDAAGAWAGTHGGARDRLGAVGFGQGGRAVWLYDADSPALKAAIVWYAPLGGPTSPERPRTALSTAGSLHAPLLGLYGVAGSDTPRRALFDAESQAKEAGRTVETVVYTDAGGDFARPGQPGYREGAALDGWMRTLAWLRRHGVG